MEIVYKFLHLILICVVLFGGKRWRRGASVHCNLFVRCSSHLRGFGKRCFDEAANVIIIAGVNKILKSEHIPLFYKVCYSIIINFYFFAFNLTYFMPADFKDANCKSVPTYQQLYCHF